MNDRFLQIVPLLHLQLSLSFHPRGCVFFHFRWVGEGVRVRGVGEEGLVYGDYFVLFWFAAFEGLYGRV